MLKPEDFYKALRDVESAPVEGLVRKAPRRRQSGAADVLNQGLIGGMAIIGKEFKARDLWVPDVLLAARNMKQGSKSFAPFFPGKAKSPKGGSFWGR